MPPPFTVWRIGRHYVLIYYNLQQLSCPRKMDHILLRISSLLYRFIKRRFLPSPVGRGNGKRGTWNVGTWTDGRIWSEVSSQTQAPNLRIYEFTQAPANRNRAFLYLAELRFLRFKFKKKSTVQISGRFYLLRNLWCRSNLISIILRVSATPLQRASGIYAVVAGGCDWPVQ